MVIAVYVQHMNPVYLVTIFQTLLNIEKEHTMDTANHTTSSHPPQTSTDITALLYTQLAAICIGLPTYTWSDIGSSILRNLLLVAASMMLSSGIAYVFAWSERGRGEFCFSWVIEDVVVEMEKVGREVG
jgi:hypothetical protein